MMMSMLFFLLAFLPLSAAAGDINVCCQEKPYGGIIADISTGRGIQPRLYNGKEFDMMHSLRWHDHGARLA
jgi:hypothetical protein